jgi:hypothetical protein
MTDILQETGQVAPHLSLENWLIAIGSALAVLLVGILPYIHW